MTKYTLTYNRYVDGWTSFFSYHPDWMVGMNQSFYTFKGGNLYQHNTNPLRNNFYGVQYNSRITSVFNELPTQNKIYKAIGLHGDSAWALSAITDIQVTGEADVTFFEKKEGVFFSYIRNNSTVPSALSDYALRITNGIGQSISVNTAVPTNNIISFDSSLAAYLPISSMISVGDYMYFSAAGTPTYCGLITAVEVDIPAGINRIRINTTVGTTTPIPTNVEYFLYIKSGEIESPGILGHYMEFTLENTSTGPVELFSVEADVMKSYP